MTILFKLCKFLLFSPFTLIIITIAIHELLHLDIEDVILSISIIACILVSIIKNINSKKVSN